jgi:hypothetical protein
MLCPIRINESLPQGRSAVKLEIEADAQIFLDSYRTLTGVAAANILETRSQVDFEGTWQ